MALAVSCAVSGACGGRAAPAHHEPHAAPTTAALVDQAHDAERARRYDRARSLYQQAIRQAPDADSAAFAWREMASALLFWGEDAGAEAALERVVALSPKTVSAWHDLGIVRGRRGDAAGAEAALRRAVALAPVEPRSRIALAAVLVNARRWDDALVEYRALERLDLPERLRGAVARAIEICQAERAREQR